MADAAAVDFRSPYVAYAWLVVRRPSDGRYLMVLATSPSTEPQYPKQQLLTVDLVAKKVVKTIDVKAVRLDDSEELVLVVVQRSGSEMHLRAANTAQRDKWFDALVDAFPPVKAEAAEASTAAE